MVKSKVVVLKKNGTVKWLTAKDAIAKDGDDWYQMAPERTYLEQRVFGIRKLTVFVEGDPEAVSQREPVGLDSKAIRMLAGPLIPRLLAESLGPQNKRGLDLKWFLLLGVLVAGGFVGYIASHYAG